MRAKTPTPHGLFPEPTPTRTGHLKVGDGHSLYYEEIGNPKGQPILFLHGGPGSGISPKTRRMANPKTSRIIVYDQRGCGKSTPYGSIKANTTRHLVDDIEKLRTHLGIERWAVAGFSWGCTLALAYAQAYPKRVQGLVVGGVFLGTQRELDWMSHPDGLARFLPLEYAMLMDALGSPAPSKVNAALLRLLKSGNAKKARTAVIAWNRLEGNGSVLNPDRAAMEADRQANASLSLALMEAHYFDNACFLAPNQLTKGISRIAHIPLHIVQAELDMVCPPETAIALHAAHPNSTLAMVPMCGHRANEQGLAARAAAVQALMKSLARRR